MAEQKWAFRKFGLDERRKKAAPVKVERRTDKFEYPADPKLDPKKEEK